MFYKLYEDLLYNPTMEQFIEIIDLDVDANVDGATLIIQSSHDIEYDDIKNNCTIDQLKTFKEYSDFPFENLPNNVKKVMLDIAEIAYNDIDVENHTDKIILIIDGVYIQTLKRRDELENDWDVDETIITRNVKDKIMEIVGVMSCGTI